MILVTSEDEQLLSRALAAIQDLVHVAHYFENKALVTSTFTYLTSIITSFVLQCSSKPSPSQQSLSPLDSTTTDISAWKCIHAIQLLFRLTTQYATSLETVRARSRAHRVGVEVCH